MQVPPLRFPPQRAKTAHRGPRIAPVGMTIFFNPGFWDWMTTLGFDIESKNVTFFNGW